MDEVHKLEIDSEEALFADGHAAFVQLGENERDRLDIYTTDKFTWMYFRFLGTGDFTELDASVYQP